MAPVGVATIVEVGIVLEGFPNGHVRLEDGIHLVALVGGEVRGAVFAELNHDDLIQVGERFAVCAHAPVIGAGFEDTAFADHIFFHGERAGADRFLGQVAAKGRGDDASRVLGQVFGDENGRALEFQGDGVIVGLFHAGEIEITHRAKHGGLDGFGQPLLEVEHDIIGGQFLSVVELDALAQDQCPGEQVIAGIPTFQQVRMGNALRIGVGQVFDDVTPRMRSADQREGRGVVHALDAGGRRSGFRRERCPRRGLPSGPGSGLRSPGQRWRVAVSFTPQAAKTSALAIESPSKAESLRKSRREILPARNCSVASVTRG